MGAHHLERTAAILGLCYGVFSDQPIFRYNYLKLSSSHVYFKLWGLTFVCGDYINSRKMHFRKPTATFYRTRKPQPHNVLSFLCLLLVCSTWFAFFVSTTRPHNSDENKAHSSIYSCRPFKTSHTSTNVTPETTASKCIYCPNTSQLLLCMDVESNPGPQRISDLPSSTKELFNTVKRTKLKLVRYESHLANFTTYANNNLIPKGLLPNCTPAIHSDNPLFWRKWNENLDNLARKQLQLLLEETHNHIKVLTILLNNQLENLRASVNNYSTGVHHLI